MEELVRENRKLRRSFNALVKKAAENQRILEHFQSFELELLSCQSIYALLHKLLVDARSHFNLAACQVIWWDPEGVVRELLDFQEIQDFEGTFEFVDSDDVFYKIYKNGFKPKLAPLRDSDKALWFPGAANVESCAMLPLTRHNMVFGSIHFGSDSRRRFTPDKAVDFMSRLASIISLCVENCVNQEHLRRLSMIDMLTRVKNRRSFDQNLSKELSRASRSIKPLSCLFIDLDHFKKVNDTYGHQAGDQALKNIAQVIDQQLRQTDHLARYGGEEFAALLPDCSRETAIYIAERVRRAAEHNSVKYEGKKPFTVTLSIGMSTWYPSPEDQDGGAEELLGQRLVAKADSAVYEAKRGGRNRVCFKRFEESKNTLMV